MAIYVISFMSKTITQIITQKMKHRYQGIIIKPNTIFYLLSPSFNPLNLLTTYPVKISNAEFVKITLIIHISSFTAHIYFFFFAVRLNWGDMCPTETIKGHFISHLHLLCSKYWDGGIIRRVECGDLSHHI